VERNSPTQICYIGRRYRGPTDEGESRQLNKPFAVESWRQQYRPVLGLPLPCEATVSKWVVSHPLEAGFVSSIGEAAGQKADFRLPLDDGREIHVREYDEHYTVHWDQVSAIRNPIGHLVADAPHWILVVFLGAVMALLIFGGREEQ